MGRELVRDARYLGLAGRVIAELGAHFNKTYYCEPGFDEVVAGTPIPVVIAGGKKLPEVGRALGEGIKEFKKAIQGKDDSEDRKK